LQVATELGSLDNLSVKDRQRLGFALLVELLAFQFASPVQWIKTMDIILGDRNMARVVELGARVRIGPSAIVHLVPLRLLANDFICWHTPRLGAMESRCDWQ
jgi:hypothetical protein